MWSRNPGGLPRLSCSFGMSRRWQRPDVEAMEECFRYAWKAGTLEPGFSLTMSIPAGDQKPGFHPLFATSEG